MATFSRVACQTKQFFADECFEDDSFLAEIDALVDSSLTLHLSLSCPALLCPRRPHGSATEGAGRGGVLDKAQTTHEAASPSGGALTAVAPSGGTLPAEQRARIERNKAVAQERRKQARGRLAWEEQSKHVTSSHSMGPPAPVEMSGKENEAGSPRPRAAVQDEAVGGPRADDEALRWRHLSQEERALDEKRQEVEHERQELVRRKAELEQREKEILEREQQRREQEQEPQRKKRRKTAHPQPDWQEVIVIADDEIVVQDSNAKTEAHCDGHLHREAGALPEHWQTGTCSRNRTFCTKVVQCFEILPASEEHRKVVSIFQQDAQEAQKRNVAVGSRGVGAFFDAFEVLKLERIENVDLWATYRMHKARMSEKGCDPNEIWAVHGSDASSLTNIAEYGFNRSYTGKNGTVYGQGTYFAKIGNFAYSTAPQYARPDALGHLRFILANVVQGRKCRGAPEQVEPPKDAQGQRYDTTGDDTDSILVTYKDFQTYPHYLVTFQRRCASAPRVPHAAPSHASAMASARAHMSKARAHMQAQQAGYGVAAAQTSALQSPANIPGAYGQPSQPQQQQSQPRQQAPRAFWQEAAAYAQAYAQQNAHAQQYAQYMSQGMSQPQQLYAQQQPVAQTQQYAKQHAYAQQGQPQWGGAQAQAQSPTQTHTHTYNYQTQPWEAAAAVQPAPPQQQQQHQLQMQQPGQSPHFVFSNGHYSRSLLRLQDAVEAPAQAPV